MVFLTLQIYTYHIFSTLTFSFTTTQHQQNPAFWKFDVINYISNNCTIIMF